MYPAAFDYVAPRSLEQTLGILAERGEDVKVLAGGQSLIPLMKLRLAAPGALVDINRVPGLNGIETANGHLRIGALTRHSALAASDLVRTENDTMASAAPWISDPLVRNLGTIGGSLAHADPQGDWGAVMLACGADVVARSTRGERVIPVSGFFVDLFQSSLAGDELLTEVHVPRYTGPAGGAYLKLERKVGDYATVGVAVHLQLDAARSRIEAAGIGLTAVGPTNLKATEAESLLVGQAPGDELFAEAAQRAAAAAEPRSDVRGSAEYKRHVLRVFVRRGLDRALERARAARGA